MVKARKLSELNPDHYVKLLVFGVAVLKICR